MRSWLTFVFILSCVSGTTSASDGWQAGTAKIVITPQKPTWMAGYGARTKPSEGKIHDLWAKALALKDPSGTKTVIVTLDVCGIGGEVSNEIRDAIKTKHGIDRKGIVLACSHTHSGPVIGGNLISMYKIDEAQHAVIREYTASFITMVQKVVDESFSALEPVDIAWGTSRADFAVNRRTNKEPEVPDQRAVIGLKGPFDHDVPVLRVNAAGRLKAVICGYACHCTVLSGNQFCGDYAGFAQIDLEKAHPGAQAMFIAGCGADQNPLPRRTSDIAAKYGHQLAEAVDDVIENKLHPVTDKLAASYEEIPLKFMTIPTKAEIETQLASKDFYTSSRAKYLLARIEKSGPLSPTYPYPVQVWKLGGLTWVFLGGEVVVDYSLRIRGNLGTSHTWVSGYCNDVMAYIPSLRVLKEGGYEGGGSMLYYGQPSPWSESVEEDIIKSIDRQIKALQAAH
jgi:hypothetical protein